MITVVVFIVLVILLHKVFGVQHEPTLDEDDRDIMLWETLNQDDKDK